MQIFLDLEGTVINQWATAIPINVEPIRKFLRDHNVNEVRIFSFAIWHPHDVENFKDRIGPMLEDLLDVRISGIVSVADMRCSDTQFTGVHFDSETDFIAIRGKDGAFTTWCLANHRGQESVLIDDVVPNRSLKDFDTETIITTVNVEKILAEHAWEK